MQGSYVAINAPSMVASVVSVIFRTEQKARWEFGGGWRSASASAAWGKVGDAELLVCAGTRVSAGLKTVAACLKEDRSVAEKRFCV